MPWWKFWKSSEEVGGPRSATVEAARPPEAGEPTSGWPSTVRVTTRPREAGEPVIRDAERRALRRLLSRRDDLTYDLERSQSAFQPNNTWTERIAQLDAAIAQAEADLQAIVPPPRAWTSIGLPPTPVEFVEVSTADPASVVLRVADAVVTYREEPDWAERGHQLALPQLTRADGDVASLVPSDIPDDERHALTEHLRHSFAIVADDALERALAGEAPPEITLADQTRPCERCGGWLDPKGRCSACVELDWRRGQVRGDIEGLRHERENVRRDLERARDRLPIIQRQVAETDSDIQKLRAKGVEPA